MKRKRKWGELKQTLYDLRAKYPHWSVPVTAQYLGVSPQSVKCLANRYGLKFPPEHESSVLWLGREAIIHGMRR